VADKTRTPVTTRRGDGGYTSLWGGDEVPKYDPRPDAYGTVEEATAFLGMARLATRHAEIRRELTALHLELYRVMTDLASGKVHKGELAVTEAHVLAIDSRIERIRDVCELPALFVVPATHNSAVLDVARTVVRRSERLVARLVHDGVIENVQVLKFLNRVSDLLFVLARWEEKLDGVPYQTISASDLEEPGPA
jgi:cob(I)alamin adenosyltransferase